MNACYSSCWTAPVLLNFTELSPKHTQNTVDDKRKHFPVSWLMALVRPSKTFDRSNHNSCEISHAPNTNYFYYMYWHFSFSALPSPAIDPTNLAYKNALIPLIFINDHENRYWPRFKWRFQCVFVHILFNKCNASVIVCLRSTDTI